MFLIDVHGVEIGWAGVVDWCIRCSRENGARSEWAGNGRVWQALVSKKGGDICFSFSFFPTGLLPDAQPPSLFSVFPLYLDAPFVVAFLAISIRSLFLLGGCHAPARVRYHVYRHKSMWCIFGKRRPDMHSDPTYVLHISSSLSLPPSRHTHASHSISFLPQIHPSTTYKHYHSSHTKSGKTLRIITQCRIALCV